MYVHYGEGKKMGILEILKQNNSEINTIVGVIGVVISALGAFFGYKAYDTALDIFEKGIQINEQKILNQVSLELVMDFCIPFSKFSEATEMIWDGINVSTGKIEQMEISYIRTSLNNRAFSINFPYIDLHKGEIWDALGKCEGMNMTQAEAFKLLMDFTDKARKFDRFLTDISERINYYMNPNDPKLAKERASAKVEKFFEEYKGYNKSVFSEVDRMIKDIKQDEIKLSKVFRINEIKKELYRI